MNGVEVIRWRRLSQVALALFVATLPWRLRLAAWPRPRPPIYNEFTDVFLLASDVFLLILLVAWPTGVRTTPERRPLRTGPRVVWWSILGLLITVGVSVLVSWDRALSLYHLVRVALLTGLYLYIVNGVADDEEKVWSVLEAGVSLQLVVLGTVAVGQFWQQRSLGLSWLGEHTLAASGPGVAGFWSEGMLWLRAYGLADHPNLLGGTLGLGLLFLLLTPERSPQPWRAMARAIVLALGTAGLLVSLSSTAWLATAGGLVVGLLMLRGGKAPARIPGLRHRLLTVALAGLLCLLAFRGVRLYVTGVSSEEREAARQWSMAERDFLVEAANDQFQRSAVTGTGIGTAPQALKGALYESGFDIQPPHVVILDVAVEIGIVGGLFYVVASLTPWFILAAGRRRWTPCLVAASAVLAAVTLLGLLEYYPWSLPYGRGWQWLAWAVWTAAYLGRDEQEPAGEPATTP